MFVDNKGWEYPKAFFAISSSSTLVLYKPGTSSLLLRMSDRSRRPETKCDNKPEVTMRFSLFWSQRKYYERLWCNRLYHCCRTTRTKQHSYSDKAHNSFKACTMIDQNESSLFITIASVQKYDSKTHVRCFWTRLSPAPSKPDDATEGSFRIMSYL